MKRTPIATLALALAAIPASAQAPRVSGTIQVWYTQMLDNNLRLNSTNLLPATLNATRKYYNLRSEYQENGFAIRRTELKFSGKVWEEEGKSLDYEVMMDPSIGTGSSNMLQDAALHLKWTGGLEVKVGQFKSQQTYEGASMSSSELMFAERSQMGRTMGDTRDRGGMVSWSFGNPKEFATKVIFGVFNGAGKVNDANAQKDYVARLEFTAAKAHRFGLYTLQGATDQADKGALSAKTFVGTAPTATAVLEDKDQTDNLGAYYVYQDATWTLVAEAITGTLGRRAAAVGAAGVANREHLDQKFMGFYAAGAYTTGRHTFAARYDSMNYNHGDDWYTPYNPYTKASATTALSGDYTPKYTEATLGWTYALKPESVKAANVKLNYIARSKNFLAPRAGQSGEQGGDTLMLAFQVAF